MSAVSPVTVFSSSEDPAFPARNLLEGAFKDCDERKQWLCRSPAEKFAYVIIRYEKPFIISSLEIKNNGSACIQIEGGNSSDPGTYKTLWKVISSMTAAESREDINGDRTYSFLSQDMIPAERNKEWDTLKIMCSQPFNKQIQYGLTHVIARSSLKVKSECKNSPCKLAVHVPALQREPYEPSLQSASGTSMTSHQQLPSRFSQAPGNDQASATSYDMMQEPPQPLPPPPLPSTWDRGQQSSPFQEEQSSLLDDTPVTDLVGSQTPQRQILISPVKPERVQNEDAASDCECEESEILQSPQHRQRFGSQSTPVSLAPSSSVVQHTSEQQANCSMTHSINSDDSVCSVKTPPKVRLKRDHSDDDSDSDSDVETMSPVPKIQKQIPITYKPFNKLLEGVEIVISGFVNPARAEIRSRAMKMGAKYNPNWSENSTHLICAFLHTPKYREAQGEGLVVTRQWIDECFTQRKRLPWKKFALNPAERSDSCQDGEIWESPSGASPSSSENVIGSSQNITTCGDSPAQIRSNPPQHNQGNLPSGSSGAVGPTAPLGIPLRVVKLEKSSSAGCSINQQDSPHAPPTSSNEIGSTTANHITIKQEIQMREDPAPTNSTTEVSCRELNYVQDARLCNAPRNQDAKSPQFPPNTCPAQVERRSDGYAGYYRPNSQPSLVAVPATHGTYYAPSMIMFPQPGITHGQFLVPASQSFSVVPPTYVHHNRNVPMGPPSPPLAQGPLQYASIPNRNPNNNPNAGP